MKKKYIILIHIVFWITTSVLQVLPLFTFDDISAVQRTLIHDSLRLFFLIIIFYIFYFWVMKIFLKKKILLFFLVSFLVISAYTFLIMFVFPAIYFKIVIQKKEIDYLGIYLSMFSMHFVYALWGTFIRTTVDWFYSRQRQKNLEKQTITGELALLRSQINPHFLFNTLNNLNSFISRDPDKTCHGIEKLSEIMRYMLYDANTPLVPIESEINYIKNYISLQQLRIKETDYVSFSIEGSTAKKMMPPMLLIPFIENAFKHGKKQDVSPGIIIKLKVDGKKMIFSIKNYLLYVTSPNLEVGGFGLKNIKSRLDLLYGDKYSLEIKKDAEFFIVELTLLQM